MAVDLDCEHKRVITALQSSSAPIRLSRMPRRVDRLLFVYNADSGTLNAIIDSAKKLLAADLRGRIKTHAAVRDLEVRF
jgi:hypothetical protein